MQFLPSPPEFRAPVVGNPIVEIFCIIKLDLTGLLCDAVSMILHLASLVQHRLVMDRWMERQTASEHIHAKKELHGYKLPKIKQEYTTHYATQLAWIT